MTLRTAIIGSGNIGCDVLCKVQRSALLDCTLFAGRNASSPGLALARARGVPVTDRGAEGLFAALDSFDVVFDATSSAAHQAHAPALEAAGKVVVNLTPAPNGALCVPSLNGDALLKAGNINMITCGGQASIPIAQAMTRANPDINYLEVVSSISAESAGPATRLNLNHYIETTESALRQFTGCSNVKAILNINPAKPNVYMQTAISALAAHHDLAAAKADIAKAVARLRAAVPGYDVIVEPHVTGDRLFTMVRVTGAGDYLDPSAGNLDIITAAATKMAEAIARAGGRRGAAPAVPQPMESVA
ncbi:acetaldehyde dehydrogenase (acetylating) [Leisingera sp. MMG026]|uniref:acetaldehyde dehydrogenase (acetylating) n=1 Tax=Leisingera sp. MMG026 TaxID=2909982 RepID=UPI001F012079|nr:acetaldehyde dehydrogenase (acetylating) [Leisingera sp. MMG026]MCF6431152.1 acetaldehyde dehydrogenase (acetylating) [Leisingera sp. MMG026]